MSIVPAKLAKIYEKLALVRPKALRNMLATNVVGIIIDISLNGYGIISGG